MLKFTTTAAALALALVLPGPGFAQEPPALPAACLSDAAPAAMPMEDEMSMDHSVDEAHAALMVGMATMNANMMIGASAADIDVAFVCGMIPHHQGAIDMARAELQYGKDEWARAMAQKVIDAQTQEIANMTKWLEDRAK